MSSPGTPAGTTVQNVTTNTSNLPAYAQPYFTDLMTRGQALSKQSYVPYPDPDQRIAGFSDLQTQAQNQAGNLQTPDQYGTATGIAQQAGLGALSAGQNFAPTQFSSQNVNAPKLNQYNIDPSQNFGVAQADQYMSPYIQKVLDLQKEQALRDAQQGQLVANLGAARQGTYGGARQLLAGTERERNLANTQANITASGLQAAYQNAQQQFNADRAAQFGVNQANQNANLGVQSLGAQTGMQAQLANQQYDLEAQKAAEQSKQFGSSLGLQGLSQANTAANTLANLGTAQQNAELQAIQAKNAAGASQQALQQQYLDTNYADFLRQRDYQQELLNNYSALLHGVPVTPSSTQTTYAPPPSLASQIGGLGLGALSLAKLAG
jgi:hypothetical protein